MIAQLTTALAEEKRQKVGMDNFVEQCPSTFGVDGDVGAGEWGCIVASNKSEVERGTKEKGRGEQRRWKD